MLLKNPNIIITKIIQELGEEMATDVGRTEEKWDDIAVERLQNKRSPGPDYITSETLKIKQEILITHTLKPKP
jgi:hypothetical protein